MANGRRNEVMTYMDFSIGRTGINVLGASASSRAEMTSNECTVDRMSSVCHNAAILGVRLYPGFCIARIPEPHVSQPQECIVSAATCSQIHECRSAYP